MELKRVIIRQAVPPHIPGAKITVSGKNYIGNKHYVLQEDMAPKAFITAVNNLDETRVLKSEGSLLQYFDEDFYSCSDINAETKIVKDGKQSIIVIKTEIGSVYINYNYYCYLKKLKLEFRFKAPNEVIGLFKDNELVGILCPIKLK